MRQRQRASVLPSERKKINAPKGLYMTQILLVLFLSVFSCLLPHSAGAQTAPVKVIAFAQDTLSNDFRLAQVHEVRDAVAHEPGLRFVYSDAQGQTALLIRQIEQFISQKVDALVLGTNDERAVVPVVSKAMKAGIPVIVLDRGIQGHDYSSFIHSDNLQIGRLAAEFIANELHGRGRVLLFEGLQTADVTHLRSKGFMAVMAAYPNITVIKRTGNYLRKDALVAMDKLLAQGNRVDAIFAESDSMLSGARLALEKHQLDPHALVTVGCDYTSEARDAIRHGTQTASVLFPLGGTKAVDIAKKLLAKQAVPQQVAIAVKLVTRDNLNQVQPIF
jgi:ribose transport system substrate-binding protein